MPTYSAPSWQHPFVQRLKLSRLAGERCSKGVTAGDEGVTATSSESWVRPASPAKEAGTPDTHPMICAFRRQAKCGREYKD